MTLTTRAITLALAAAAVLLTAPVAATGRTLAGVPLAHHPSHHLNSIVALLAGLL